MIPVGKVLIGAGCPGLWAIPVAHDSLFTIAMGSMIMVMPRMIFSENYWFMVSQTKVFFTSFQCCGLARAQKSQQSPSRFAPS